MTLEIVKPRVEYLDGYVDALERGWRPGSYLTAKDIEAQIRAVRAHPASFVARLDDPEAKGPPVKMPDGSERMRLPAYARWILDDDFCGTIHLRWQPGTADLPDYVLGHIGFMVVPWKRRQGRASAALRLILPEAAALGLPYVEISTDADNIASQGVITACGGVLVERFVKPDYLGGGSALRYRIGLVAD